MDISSIAFNKWVETGIQPEDYIFAVWLPQFIGEPSDVPEDFYKFDWNISFRIPVVIVYDERLTDRTLMVLHKLLRTRSCDIQNVTVITTHAIGVASWWHDYITLYNESSFHVEEWLFIKSRRFRKFFRNLKFDKTKILKSQIEFLFNCYSGTNPTVDRRYLCLKLRELDNLGIVDIINSFGIDKTSLVNNAYYLGYFKNNIEEQSISKLYDEFVIEDQLLLNPKLMDIKIKKIRSENFDFKGFQCALDKSCMATVIIESDNTQPWPMASEKTLRPFWHGNVTIHPGYKAIHYLEQFGFWFPHDIINFDYQDEKDWLCRINAMIDSLHQTHDKMSAHYNTYWSDNIDKFIHNAKLLEHYYYCDVFQKPIGMISNV